MGGPGRARLRVPVRRPAPQRGLPSLHQPSDVAVRVLHSRDQLAAADVAGWPSVPRQVWRQGLSPAPGGVAGAGRLWAAARGIGFAGPSLVLCENLNYNSRWAAASVGVESPLSHGRRLT